MLVLSVLVSWQCILPVLKHRATLKQYGPIGGSPLDSPLVHCRVECLALQPASSTAEPAPLILELQQPQRRPHTHTAPHRTNTERHSRELNPLSGRVSEPVPPSLGPSTPALSSPIHSLLFFHPSLPSLPFLSFRSLRPTPMLRRPARVSTESGFWIRLAVSTDAKSLAWRGSAPGVAWRGLARRGEAWLGRSANQRRWFGRAWHVRLFTRSWRRWG